LDNQIITMKTKIATLIMMIATTAIAQVGSVKYDTATNALTIPTAANFRAANSIQQTNAALTAITGNTGTLSLSGVTLTLPEATQFGSAKRAIIGSESGGDVTITYPTSSSTLFVPRLTVTTAFGLPVVTTNATAFTAQSSFTGAATAPILRALASGVGFTGPLIKADNSAGNAFAVQHNGDLSWQGVATGNGSAITAINAANIASGTVGTARLGTGTANASAVLHGDSAWRAIELGGSAISGVLPVTAGGSGVATLRDLIYTTAGGQELEIVGATTTDISALDSANIRITGTATITSLGGSNCGNKVVKFTDASTLVHSADLILPGGVNLTTHAGDFAHFSKAGSGAWRMVNYFPASGNQVNWQAVDQNDAVYMEIMGETLNPTGSSNLRNVGDTALAGVGTDDTKGGIRAVRFTHTKNFQGLPGGGSNNVMLPGNALEMEVNPNDTVLLLSDGPGSDDWRVVGGSYKTPLSWVQGTLAAENGGTGVTSYEDLRGKVNEANSFWLHDEFMGGLATTGNIGSLGWILNNIAGTNAVGHTSETHRPGIVALSTGSVSGNGLNLNLGPSGSGTIVDLLARPTKMTVAFKLLTPTACTLKIGMGNPIGAAPTRWYGVRFTAATDSNFMAVGYNNDGTEDQAVILAPVDTGWHTVIIERASASTARITIDAQPPVTLSTELPIGASGVPFIHFVTNAAAGKSVYLDYFDLKMTLTR
jgi:hypothetical protein